MKNYKKLNLILGQVFPFYWVMQWSRLRWENHSWFMLGAILPCLLQRSKVGSITSVVQGSLVFKGMHEECFSHIVFLSFYLALYYHPLCWQAQQKAIHFKDFLFCACSSKRKERGKNVQKYQRPCCPSPSFEWAHSPNCLVSDYLLMAFLGTWFKSLPYWLLTKALMNLHFHLGTAEGFSNHKWFVLSVCSCGWFPLRIHPTPPQPFCFVWPLPDPCEKLSHLMLIYPSGLGRIELNNSFSFILAQYVQALEHLTWVGACRRKLHGPSKESLTFAESLISNFSHYLYDQVLPAWWIWPWLLQLHVCEKTELHVCRSCLQG